MNFYGRWIQSWERELTLKDREREIYKFDWGLDWIQDNGAAIGSPLDRLKRKAAEALEESDSFYAARPMEDSKRDGDLLTFRTPTPTPFIKNNTATCQLFEAKSSRTAVVVVPQWNSDVKSHVGLCKLIRKLGMTAVRVTLPYHEARSPEGRRRADLMVSPNIGRTLHATRQAVIELRQVVRWLKSHGYERVGVMGTSLGSCVAYLAFTHDCEIDVGVFNHVSSYFADVVWSGLATRYVLWGLEGHVRLPDLRRCWAPLSPWFFVDRLTDQERPHLMITAKYDMTFLPELTEQVFERYAELGISHERVDLPCGHYTTAHFPFNWIDGWHICRYLKQHLG
jgi:hypothetical protein